MPPVYREFQMNLGLVVPYLQYKSNLSTITPLLREITPLVISSTPFLLSSTGSKYR